ncbi:porin [Citreimonas sp.]|uniref:porin n=1 Tax=Citreimonas sp. TaxID=3036715 RepID=UPI00405A1B75
MKKILFATTALVATAGIASAQGVEVSGSAEVGIVGGDRYQEIQTDSVGDFDGFENVDQLWTDVEVTFTMSGEADNGLTFGASVQLDEAANANGTDDGGATWFLAFGGARLDMGDTDGAFDAAMTEAALVGTIDDTETEYLAFNANSGLDGDYDGQIARFSYSFDAFTGFLSVEMDDTGEYEPIYGIGFSYAGNVGGLNLGVGIGYQQGDEDNSEDSYARGAADIADAVGDLPAGTYSDSELFETAYRASGADAEEVMGISLSLGTDNGFTGILNYSEAEYASVAGLDQDTETSTVVGVFYTMNALSLGLSYSQYDDQYGLDGLEANGYALAMNYDLGGGLVVQAGYAQSDVSIDGNGINEDFDSDNYSLGLSMSF